MNSTLKLIFLFFSISLFSQKPNLDNWEKSNLPLGDSLYKANNSTDDWIFEKINNDWIINQRKFHRNNGDKLEIPKEIIEKNKKIINTKKEKNKKIKNKT